MTTPTGRAIYAWEIIQKYQDRNDATKWNIYTEIVATIDIENVMIFLTERKHPLIRVISIKNLGPIINLPSSEYPQLIKALPAGTP